MLLRKVLRAFGASRQEKAATPHAPAAAAAAEWRTRGNVALGQGLLKEAAECYRHACAADPSDALAHLNFGFACLEMGDVETARAGLSRALVLRRPEQDILHDVHYLLGRVHLAQGQPALASASFEAAVQAKPSFVEPIQALAELMHDMGRHAQALEWAQRLQAVRPSAASEVIVAQQLHALQRNEEALAILDGVLQREPRNVAASTGRDKVLMSLARPSWPELLDRAQDHFTDGRFDAALETLDAADAQAGPHPLALHVRGNVLFAMGRYEEAAQAFDAACARKPDLAEAAANAATARIRLGQPQEALERAERALQLRPDHIPSLNNRVIALQALGRASQAVAAAREASLKFPDDPELRWIYGATALLNGDYENGWPALDARWQLPGAGKRPRAEDLGCPAWTGREPIEGKTLLLIAEQGFGDTLQFVRYAPQLRQRGARVVLWVQEPLQGLLSASMPDCTVVPRGQDAPPADFHLPLMEMPLVMGTRLDSIPSAVPYLRAQPEGVRDWLARLPGNGLRVGIVWSGNPAHSNDQNRSLALSALRRIAVPGICFVSLQREVRDADRAALRDSDICDVADQLRSFSDTAALVEALDLVVSVDTSVAHLAGALGKPVWILLPYRPDWRWLMDREDSPWYPTARLFRQPAPGAWEPVLDAVRVALADFAATRRASA